MTINVKRTITAILLLFFVLFPHCSSYLGHSGIIDRWYKFVFYIIHFIANQTLGIVHEAGHGVCYLIPCPEVLTAAMGTVFQWLFPAGIAWYYWKKKEYFGAFIALFFLGFSMQYTAWYMHSAHEGHFVPASKSFLGVDGYHDFNTIFSYLHLLNYDWLVSGIVRLIAYIIMLISLIAMMYKAFSTQE